MPSNGIPLDRRTVLKRIGTTAAVGTGLASTTGNAVADDLQRRRLAEKYNDESNLISAFERHGTDLRNTLVTEGFVAEDFEFRSLDVELDPEVNGVDPADEDSLAGVDAVDQDGTATAFASLSASSETHELALFVQPERDEAYALVESKEGDERLLVSDSSVSPAGCIRESCTNTSCSTCYDKGETYECDENCENCSLIDTNCSCKSCSCHQADYCTPECSYC